MAKNVGKTTTFNYIIEKLQSKFIIGITSVGRDGESKDIITNQPKPKIIISKGNLLATAEESLARSELDHEILTNTEISSAIGKIIVIRALDKGSIELSGPSLVHYLVTLCDKLKEYGAELVLIDGAFDRKSFASPVLAHSTILATGAAVSHDMEEVIQQTVFSIEKLSTSPISDVKARSIISQFFKSNKAGILDDNYTLFTIDVNTALNATEEIIKNINSKTKFIIIKGILSSNLIEQLLKYKIDCSTFKIIAEDGTKIFIAPNLYKIFRKSGGTIEVLNPINIIAVTTNPVSPYGFSFNQKTFLQRLRKMIDIPVFDIVSGG
ncbi:MAG: hypothetical protein EU530_04940 [Promethearchaeota archaeon]|nr:MAG: hypothetical protein EU530_04940 [Candidatus Lokiarchaeota archaeon]